MTLPPRNSCCGKRVCECRDHESSRWLLWAIELAGACWLGFGWWIGVFS